MYLVFKCNLIFVLSYQMLCILHNQYRYPQAPTYHIIRHKKSSNTKDIVLFLSMVNLDFISNVHNKNSKVCSNISMRYGMRNTKNQPDEGYFFFNYLSTDPYEDHSVISSISQLSP